MIFYFSGTGNSKWVAQQLAIALDDKLMLMSPTQEKTIVTLACDERVGFVFPVHSWAPPQIVLDFIKTLELRNYNDHYTYMFCTYGDDMGKTKTIFNRFLKERTWLLSSAFSLQMPNTYVSFPCFDVDSQKVEINKRTNSEKQLPQFIESIKNKREGFFLLKEGAFPRFKSYVIQPLFKHFALTDKYFKVSQNCIHCGKCVRICPINNIELKDGFPVWNNHCTTCLACYHVCPQHAISYGKFTKTKGQYTFSHLNGKNDLF